MNLFGVMAVSGSGLKAQRVRAEITAANLANVETTRTADGTPYQRQHVVFGARQSSFAGVMSGANASKQMGVQVEGLLTDQAPPLKRFEPSNPDADEQGFVSYPDINPVEEMTDLMGAVQATKNMIQQSIDILK